jgi:IS30 family transposase
LFYYELSSSQYIGYIQKTYQMFIEKKIYNIAYYCLYFNQHDKLHNPHMRKYFRKKKKKKKNIQIKHIKEVLSIDIH